MRRLWKRASGMLKDQNSLWITSFSRRTTLRNPDIEASVIKATNHDELRIDYKNFHHVLSWLRLSDVHVKPAVRCISARLQKTRSWAVAVKGLMLMHEIISTRISVVQLIGKLPFDLSNFRDGHTKLGKVWALNSFIRAYYAFLDYKSSLLYSNLREISVSASASSAFAVKQYHSSTANNNKNTASASASATAATLTISRDIMLLQKVQCLLDLLLQIKPQTTAAANVFLIVEAMDGIVMESYHIYSRMCKMIGNVVSRIINDENDIVCFTKIDIGVILRVVQKAVDQGQQLTLYFDLCREIGVERALEIPDPPKINDADIQSLKQMVLPNYHHHDRKPKKELNGMLISVYPKQQQLAAVEEENNTRAVVAIDQPDRTQNGDNRSLRTIITDDWEKFDEDSNLTMMMMIDTRFEYGSGTESENTRPFHQELPDLISF